MSLELRRSLFDQLDSVAIIDPHSHINPLDPASKSLADILGYHYYTELAHSAGMEKAQIEEWGIEPFEKVRRLIANFGPIENTIQYSWFIETAQKLFGFQGDRVTLENWESLYDAATSRMSEPDWSSQVLKASNIESVFLTNDFDDPLEGFDTSTYIPCLRTDDLVFHFAKREVRDRLSYGVGVSVDSIDALRTSIQGLFHKFTQNNARACAISLPPDFTPGFVSEGRAKTALDAILRGDALAAESHRRAISQFIFWTLADFCSMYQLPFDLMIGVNRNVYADGVHQGRDLYDSRTSLIQYRELFNAFPKVTFPVSVLASVTNQELTSYAWIFPNVVTNGHWWYSNTPTFIEHDLAARLEAVPSNKQIGYYSDMYKLEFGLPKFAMYKRILAKVLAERFVTDRGWSEERAVELGKKLLRGNVESIFGFDRPTPERPNFVIPVVAAAAIAPAWSGEEEPEVEMAMEEEAFTEEVGLESPTETVDEVPSAMPFAETPETGWNAPPPAMEYVEPAEYADVGEEEVSEAEETSPLGFTRRESIELPPSESLPFGGESLRFEEPQPGELHSFETEAEETPEPVAEKSSFDSIEFEMEEESQPLDLSAAEVEAVSEVMEEDDAPEEALSLNSDALDLGEPEAAEENEGMGIFDFPEQVEGASTEEDENMIEVEEVEAKEEAEEDEPPPFFIDTSRKPKR